MLKRKAPEGALLIKNNIKDYIVAFALTQKMLYRMVETI